MLKDTISVVTKKAPFIAATLILAGAITGIVWAFHLGNRPTYPDEELYAKIGINIAENRHFSIDGTNSTAFCPPGLPVLIAVPAALGGSMISFRLVNVASYILSLIFLYLLAARQCTRLAGMFAVMLALGYPVLVYAAGMLWPQTLAGCLVLFILWLYFRDRELTVRRAIVIGLLFGCLILTVPTFVFFLFFACVAFLFDQKWRTLARIALVPAAAALVICPWIARNCGTFDSPVFVSTNGGLNLLIGNCDTATPDSGVNVDIAHYKLQAEDMDEVERDRYFAGMAFDYMSRHPQRSLHLYGMKFLNHFNYRNALKTESETSAARELIVLVSYGLILLLAVLRVLCSRRWPLSRYERFVLLLYVSNGAFAALFHTRIRFRIPFDAMLITVCAAFVARVVLGTPRTANGKRTG